MNNIKQLGLGLVMYVQDYDETWPNATYCLFPDNETAANPYVPTATGCRTGGQGALVSYARWWMYIYPYTKSIDILRCPSRQNCGSNGMVGCYPSYGPTSWPANAVMTNAYSRNVSLMGMSNPANQTDPQQYISWAGGGLSGLTRPAETMLLMEFYTPTMPPTYDNTASTGQPRTMWPYASRSFWQQTLQGVAGGVSQGKGGAVVIDALESQSAAPHFSGLNLAYTDGHAKWLKTEQFVANCPDIPNQAVFVRLFPILGYGRPAYFNETNRQPYPMWNLE